LESSLAEFVRRLAEGEDADVGNSSIVPDDKQDITPSGEPSPTTDTGTPATPAGLAPATPAGLAPATPAGLAPATPAGLAPGTPGGLAPATPAGLAPGTPAAAQPFTPSGPAPATPAAVQGGPQPHTPFGLQGSGPQPQTPAGLLSAGPQPSTPAGLQSSGVTDELDDIERNVWEALDEELQKPLEDFPALLPVREDVNASQVRKVGEKSGDDDSDDDWGMDWKDADKEAETEDIMQKIQKEAEKAAGWEKEDWRRRDDDAQMEEADEDDENWAKQMQTGQEEKTETSTWRPDSDWHLWDSNSLEAEAAEMLVQKIRSRAGASDTPGGAFPNDALKDIMLTQIARTIEEQRRLVAALLWVEANTLEITDVPQNLSLSTVSLIGQEDALLKTICSKVPSHTMLQKALSPLPDIKVREEATKVISSLISALRKALTAGDESAEDLKEGEEVIAGLFDDIMGSQPLTVRVMSLVHAVQFAKLLKRQYAEVDMLAVAFAKQCLLERALEIVCRVSLRQALGLASALLDEEDKAIKEEFFQRKADSLNRLSMEWRLLPSEDEMAQLHVLTFHRQLQVLLNIERDIELFWNKLPSKVQNKDEQSRLLRHFLNFDRLLRPYLREEDLLAKGKQQRVLETESGLRVESLDLAKVRSGASEVLKKLYKRYGWTPELKTRREISGINWVGRLHALLSLAQKPSCLHADLELQKMIREAHHRKLGIEVYNDYQRWNKLYSGQDVRMKSAKLAPKEVQEQLDRMYSDFKREGPKFPGQGYQPQTPANLGAAGGMTPTAAGMTPGFYSSGAITPMGPGTPFRAPTPIVRTGPGTPFGAPNAGTPAGYPPGGRVAAGTPAGPPPRTPGGLAPPATPAGMPPPTPAFRRFAGPGTPAGLPPGTPGGFPPGTPGGLPPGTPAGMAPQTPFAAFQGIKEAKDEWPVPRTPAGAMPFTPMVSSSSRGFIPQTPKYEGGGSAVPMTPAGMMTPGGLMVPQTPVAALMGSAAPSTPFAAFSSRGFIPQTPKVEGNDAVPMTPGLPSSAVPMTPGAAMPFTPGSAVPMTPAAALRGGPVPMTPGNAMPLTPGGAAPMTPANAMPFTPRGPVPMTPGVAPFTPRGPVPMTPGGVAPFTPRGPMPMTPAVAPFTPAGPAPQTALNVPGTPTTGRMR
jgi:hypothetical protein